MGDLLTESEIRLELMFRRNTPSGTTGSEFLGIWDKEPEVTERDLFIAQCQIDKLIRLGKIKKEGK